MRTDPEDTGRPTSIYFGEKLLAVIDRFAKGQDRSRSSLVRQAMRERLGLLPDPPKLGGNSDAKKHENNR